MILLYPKCLILKRLISGPESKLLKGKEPKKIKNECLF